MKELKYYYAYDDKGNSISIHMAMKDEKYYFDSDKRYELILKNGAIYQKHFSMKSNYSGMNESPAHYNAKMEILHDGFFNYKNNHVYVKNCKCENMINDSRYRADIKAELLDGTECIIEIIITSDISIDKEEYLIKNNILTFKLYYDQYGNQIIQRSSIIGREEVKKIQNEYRAFLS